MSRVIEVTLYQFDELSDDAKEKARAWWREASIHDEWWEHVYSDFESIAKLMGIEFSTHQVTTMGGKTRHDPDINFSGFWSQGDGASYYGDYKGTGTDTAAKLIHGYAPTDERLAAIAAEFDRLQSKHGGRVRAKITRNGHHYSHEYNMSVDAWLDAPDAEEEQDREETLPEQDWKDLTENLRDLARWLYRALEKEYEWQNADEQVDENITANEYEFTEDGERV